MTGNSGGSAEISYALAHYGMGRIVDLAMPTSGPPMGRIDNGCLGGLQPGWLQECQALQICNGSASCQYSSAGPTGGSAFIIDHMYIGTSGAGTTDCASRNPAMQSVWYADSVVSPGAQLDYPQTEVRFIFGGADCSEAVTLGRLYADAITSAKRVTVVPLAPHGVPSVDAGAAAVYSDLIDGCVFRH